MLFVKFDAVGLTERLVQWMLPGPIIMACVDVDPLGWSAQEQAWMLRTRHWRVDMSVMGTESTSPEWVRFQAWLGQQEPSQLPSVIDIVGAFEACLSSTALRLACHLPTTIQVTWQGYQWMGRGVSRSLPA
jgi:hypothetical protein